MEFRPTTLFCFWDGFCGKRIGSIHRLQERLKIMVMNDTCTQFIATPADLHSKNGTVGAVVVGGDYQGLGIVRSLGRQGIPVCVVDDELSISRFSRYSTQFVKVPDLRDQRKAVDSLLEIGTRLSLHGWVLYPTREELVAAFSRNRCELSELFRVPTPDWDSVQWAWDKRKTYRLAEELGIPTPQTYYLDHIEQLSELDGLAPPFAIKPAIKEHFLYATKAKAWRADSHSELKILFQRASELVGPGEVMVQELIPGGGSQQFSYCAFFRDGKAVGKMVARRRRQHPLQFGRASTYVETIDVPILEELSERFLRNINYYGLVELEYKLDPRDVEYKLLDVNARTWGYNSLGASAGVDFTHMLFADQLGMPVTECKSESGVGWVRMTTDVPAALCALLAGDLDYRGYLRSLRTCNTEAVFSPEDPLPGLAEVILLPYLAIKRGF
jgi:predicted ATP-grasp superfamily ATP-dependent carboligase